MSNLDVALRLRLVNGLKAGAADAKRDLAGVGTAAKNLGRARGLDGLSRDLDASSARAKRLERQLAGLRDARGFSGLGTALDESAGGAGKVARFSHRIAANLEKAKGSATDLAGLMDRIAGASERAGRASRSLRRIQGREGRGGSAGAGGGAADAEAMVGKAGGGMLRAGLGMVGAGAAAGAAKHSVKSAMDFERAMIEVGKATNATGADLDAYGEKLLALSRETGVVKESLADMLVSAGFAGRPAEELMRFTEYASKATKAWRTNAEETSQGLAELGNIYQADQARIEQIGDAINTMADKSASRESDLLEYLRRAGASAKGAGITAEETLAFGAAMKEVGVRTDVAATGFEALLNVMKLGAEFSHKAGEGLEELGLKSTEMRRAFVAKPVETMIGLLKQLNEVADPLKKAEIMTNLFGKEYQDDIAKLLNALPQIDKYLGIMRDRSQSAGSVRMQFADQLDKDVSKIDRAVAAIDVLAKRIGDPIKTSAGGIADQINGMVDRLEKGDTILQRLATRFGPSPDEAAAGQREIGDRAESMETWAEENLPFLSGRKWNEWIDAKLGKTGQEAAHKREMAPYVRAAEQDAKVRARPNEIAEQIRRREGVLARSRERAAGAPGMQRDMAERQVGASEAEIARLKGELAKATEAVQALDRARAEELAAIAGLTAQVGSMGRLAGFGLEGVKGDGSGGIGRDAFGLGLNGTKMRAVPLPPPRPEAMKVGIEKQDLSGIGAATIGTFEQAVKAGLEKTEAEAKTIVERIKANLSFTATPTITPRISAPVGGGGAGAEGGSGAGKGKSASLGRGATQFNGPIHVHGVRNVASLERGIRREADRRAREARNDALHDTGNDFA